MSSKLRPGRPARLPGPATPTEPAGTPPRSGNLRAPLGDPAFQDQLQQLRRPALATGVLDAAAVARVEVEDLPVSPDRHAVLVPLWPAQPPQRPSRHPKPERT
jgi:hypothetical protein